MQVAPTVPKQQLFQIQPTVSVAILKVNPTVPIMSQIDPTDIIIEDIAPVVPRVAPTVKPEELDATHLDNDIQENSTHFQTPNAIVNSVTLPVMQISQPTAIPFVKQKFDPSRHCVTCMEIYKKTGKKPTRSSFNQPGKMGATHCGKHKNPTMVNTNNKKCRACKNHAPYFNYEGQKGGVYCSGCKNRLAPEMVDVIHKKCECGCGQIPSFGYPTDQILRRCSKNQLPGMIDLKHKRCEWPNCTKGAYYNMLGEITPRFCYTHSEDGMINLHHKSDCPGENGEGCHGRSTYNLPTEKRGVYCTDHKKPGMVNMRDAKCPGKDNIGCPNSRIYNSPGLKPLYCKAHKSPEMIDLVSKRCLGKDNNGLCTKRPSYNTIGCTVPIYCKECKDHNDPDMIDVKHKRCDECSKIASFNFLGNKNPLKCTDHKDPEMVNIKHRYCEHHSGCNTLANFNFPGMNAIYCVGHAIPGMVKVGQKICETEGCEEKSKFNFPGETIRRFCFTHKEEGMVNLNHKIGFCVQPGCDNLPLFNLQSKKPIYCNDHKSPNMVNLEQAKKCSLADCSNLPIARFDDNYYCPTHYPDQTALAILNRECRFCDRNFDITNVCTECKTNCKGHLKEWDVVCHLKRNIDKIPILDSNAPVSECSKRRPDIYYQCETHVVIVEVDEDQHQRYQPECECARICEIVGSIGGSPVTIIRYNPDKITNNGKSVNIPRSERLEKLVDVVKSELNAKYDKFHVKLIQLFYNDDYKTYQPYKEEDITKIVVV